MPLFRRPVPSQLDRYVFRQLLAALLVSTGGLAALIWLTQSLRFLELVIDRGLSLRVFLELTGLLIPGFVAVILPITTFLVILFLYLRLAADRELTVMRAAGLSHFALARPALGLAFVSLAACFWLNLGIVPSSVAAFRQYQFEIRNRIAAFLLQEGVFTPVSDNLTVYVRKRDVDGTLHGILVDDARDPDDQATILAECGRIADGPDGPEVLLFHGSRQVIDRRTGRLNVLTFAENTIDLTANGGGPQQRFRDASELPLRQLLHPDPASVAPRDMAKFRVEAFRRLSTPFTAVSFALLALYAVLAGAFRRHGGLLRTAAAVGGVVGLLAVQLAIADLAQRIPAMMPLIWIEAILPGLVFAWLLFAPPSHFSWRLRGAGTGLAPHDARPHARSLLRPAVPARRPHRARRADRARLALRLHRDSAPRGTEARCHVRAGRRDRGAAPAVAPDAAPAVLRADRRDLRLLAAHPLLRAGRRPRGGRLDMADSSPLPSSRHSRSASSPPPSSPRSPRSPTRGPRP